MVAAVQPAPSPAKSLDDTRRELAELRLLLFNNIHDLACHSADERLQLAANIACVNLINRVETFHLQWEKLRLRQQTLALAERHVELAERREDRIEQHNEPRASASGPADTRMTCSQPAPPAPAAPYAEQPAPPSEPPLTPEELAEIAESFPSTKPTDIDPSRDAACWRDTLRITRHYADLFRAARKEAQAATNAAASPPAPAPAPGAGASPALTPHPALAMSNAPAAPPSDAPHTSPDKPASHDPALIRAGDLLPELCARTAADRFHPS